MIASEKNRQTVDSNYQNHTSDGDLPPSALFTRTWIYHIRVSGCMAEAEF